MTTHQIFAAALSLPDEAKATLAEKLIAHLASRIEPEVEQAHLSAATQRRAEILSGKVQALDGEAVMARARKLVGE